MSGTGGPPRQSLGTDNPLVGRIDGWSHKRREAPDRTPPIDRLTIAPSLIRQCLHLEQVPTRSTLAGQNTAG